MQDHFRSSHRILFRSANAAKGDEDVISGKVEEGGENNPAQRRSIISSIRSESLSKKLLYLSHIFICFVL
jgi:hypothetical protein